MKEKDIEDNEFLVSENFGGLVNVVRLAEEFVRLRDRVKKLEAKVKMLEERLGGPSEARESYNLSEL